MKLWFNNKNSKPDWWDARVVEVYLGEWSPEKFETLVIATNGITSFEGLFAGEMRRYSLMLKDYICLLYTSFYDMLWSNFFFVYYL